MSNEKNIQTARGFRDIWFPDSKYFTFLYAQLVKISESFNCQEVFLPILEDINLFIRGIGSETDIVKKEMFILDIDDEKLVLRPEGTASLVRAMLNKGQFSGRYFYYIDCFRKERPQKGRFRQFKQFGVELFGSSDISLDIECLHIISKMFKDLNLPFCININCIGSSMDRKKYSNILHDYLKINYNNLSNISKDRFNNQHYLRILDSKETEDQNVIQDAPVILNYLTQKSIDNFNTIQEFLIQTNTPFVQKNTLVRGLDYYNDLVFEVTVDNYVGSNDAIAGGGRYDGLFSTYNSNYNVPAVGFAIGVDRLVSLLNNLSIPFLKTILIVPFTKNWQFITEVIQKIQSTNKYSTEMYNSSLTEALRYANKNHYPFVCIINENLSINIKNMISGLETQCDLSLIQNYI